MCLYVVSLATNLASYQNNTYECMLAATCSTCILNKKQETTSYLLKFRSALFSLCLRS